MTNMAVFPSVPQPFDSQPCSNSSARIPRYSSSIATFFISSSVMQSGMSIHYYCIVGNADAGISLSLFVM